MSASPATAASFSASRDAWLRSVERKRAARRERVAAMVAARPPRPAGPSALEAAIAKIEAISVPPSRFLDPTAARRYRAAQNDRRAAFEAALEEAEPDLTPGAYVTAEKIAADCDWALPPHEIIERAVAKEAGDAAATERAARRAELLRSLFRIGPDGSERPVGDAELVRVVAGEGRAV